MQYQKHMCHHLPEGPVPAWVTGLTTVLLVRDPREVVASYVRSRASVEPADIGLLQQERLLDSLLAAGQDPPVVDAGDFLRNPEGYLRWWCDWLGLAFTDAMLHWPAGPRPSDGIWAPYWYAAVLASTGFAPWRPRTVDLSPARRGRRRYLPGRLPPAVGSSRTALTGRQQRRGRQAEPGQSGGERGHGEHRGGEAGRPRSRRGRRSRRTP